MNAIGIVALILFVIAWATGVISWFYMAYHIALVWLGRGTPFEGLIKGLLGFLACGLFATLNGLIGGWFGGWQTCIGFTTK
jgi:hypothetical protein